MNNQAPLGQSHVLKQYQNLKSGLEDQLKCPVCLEIFHRCATFNPCQHNLCGSCLLTHLKSSKKCPVCRECIKSITKSSVICNLVELTLNNSPNLQRPKNSEAQEEIDLIGDVIDDPRGVFISKDFNGKKEGKGTLIDKGGSLYAGLWKNDKKEGKGVFISQDRNKYEGDFVNDTYNGKGKFTWANGKEYEGDWKDGQKHGYGTLKFTTGMTYKENWNNGLNHGRGIMN